MQSDQSLQNVRIMVTRPDDPHEELAERLRRLGAEIIAQPAIRITPPSDWAAVDDALVGLAQFDWLVFSSANGVRGLLDRWMQRRGDFGPLRGIRLAAIGPGTADELARFGLTAHLVPREYRAEALAEALTPEARGRRFLLVRASRGREVLAEQLTAAGAHVEQVVVYQSLDVERPEPEIAAQLHANRIDWVTVTSSAIARSLVRLFGEDLRRSKLASISPITSGVLRQLGYEPAAEAAEYTMRGLAAVIVQACSR